jgi:anti-sigma B factor antagonist
MSDAEPAPLQVDVRSEGSVIWIDTAGEIDISTSPRWEGAMANALAARPDRIYVEMHRVSFIDSSGLAVLVRYHGLADSQNCQLIIRSPAQPVDRVLGLAGLKQHLTIEE